MKIVHATPMESPMDENSVKEFLASKMNLQIATIDSDGLRKAWKEPGYRKHFEWLAKEGQKWKKRRK